MGNLLSGNEAIARGAWESGVRIAAGYPGTPSTEILEALSGYDDVHTQWSPNEKVALEFAFGASLGGARTLTAMKHVGLNVAADPLFTSAYAGVNAGLVIVSTDDPSMHSSQNEQDNRNYGKAAKIPVVEPIDSQTALELSREGFSISERFDTPVLLRTTTRICHTKSLAYFGTKQETKLRPYTKQPEKYLMVPSVSRRRRLIMESRLEDLEAYANHTPFNRMEIKDRDIGIITSGIASQYVRELFPEASILVLMMYYPFPRQIVEQFSRQVRKLLVVEELDPIIETEVRNMGLNCIGKDRVPRVGELNPDVVRNSLLDDSTQVAVPGKSPTPPPRPPTLCPGCGHRSVFYVLKKLSVTVMGDIGCYTLGALKPLNAMDGNLCMGASIGMAHGLQKARSDANEDLRLVAVIGDSTFIHSGITALIDVVYNAGTVTTVLLDNQVTAMTGHQDHPGSGSTLKGHRAPKLDYEKLAEAIGLARVRVVNPYDLNELETVLGEEVANGEPSLVIARAPCALHSPDLNESRAKIDPGQCVICDECLDLGCPAIRDNDGVPPKVEEFLCVGCDMCVQVCPTGAFHL